MLRFTCYSRPILCTGAVVLYIVILNPILPFGSQKDIYPSNLRIAIELIYFLMIQYIMINE